MSRDYILHNEQAGSGETIVLLHGYLSSAHYFSKIIPPLAKTNHVVALDLLGFGMSPKPRVHYTYADHIAAIHATLESIGISKPYTLLGHSMGALIALRYATIYGDDISRLHLFNPPMFTHAEQAINSHKATGLHYRALLYSRARNGYWKALQLVPHNVTKRRPPINFADTVRMSKHAREGSYKHVIMDSDLFFDLRKTTMPVTLVVGKYDRVVYQENLKNHTLPLNVTLLLIETGHHPIVRNQKQAHEIITSHLLQ